MGEFFFDFARYHSFLSRSATLKVSQSIESNLLSNNNSSKKKREEPIKFVGLSKTSSNVTISVQDLKQNDQCLRGIDEKRIFCI